MTINVANLQKKVRLSPQRIQKILTAILRRERIQDVSLSVVFVTARKIRALNQKFLKHSYPTDVLAFNLKDVWEIVVSTDAAVQNAKRFKTSVQKEITLYLIHGILHLLGYNDHNSKDVQKMREKERELVNFLDGKTI